MKLKTERATFENLVSDVGRCSDGEAQTQHHAGCLGDQTDQVEGRGRLIRGTVDTGLDQLHLSLGASLLLKI